MSNYRGHGTLPDGTHVPLTEEVAQALWEASERASKREAELMPDIAAVLRMASGVRNRLHKLGWSEGQYCPKDGRDFAVITNGCSAILTGCYVGEWPHGEIYVLDGSYDPRQVWWKALSKITEDERDKMYADMAFNEACIEGHTARMMRVAELAQDAE